MVRMAREQHAIYVPGFTLEPVGGGIDGQTSVGTGVSSSVCTLRRMRWFKRHATADDRRYRSAGGARASRGRRCRSDSSKRYRIIAQEEAAPSRCVSARNQTVSAPAQTCQEHIGCRASCNEVIVDREHMGLIVHWSMKQDRRVLLSCSCCRFALSGRSCRCGGSSSAAAEDHRPALPRSAGSPEHRCPPARCGHSRAPPNRNSGSSRRRWRSCPSR